MIEHMFDTMRSMPAPTGPDSLATAASQLTALDVLPRDLSLATAHVLREASAQLGRGMPLPIRLHSALGELVAAVEQMSGRRAGDELDFP